MMNFLKITVACLIIIAASCRKEIPIPSYIHIDSISLSTDYAGEGTASHKITDAWAYVEGLAMGGFEMPCTFPVLHEGKSTIRVYAGIKDNGVTNTRVDYPFYDYWEIDTVLTRIEKLVLSPKIKYSSIAQLAWHEDFEGSMHSFFKKDGSTKDTEMQLISGTDVFEKNGSGKVSISSDSWWGQSDQFALTRNAPVYLELNYKCNAEFDVGIVGFSSSGIAEATEKKITLRPSEIWNKIYINFTEEVGFLSSYPKHAIYFSLTYNDSLSSSQVFLDNIKLLHSK